MVRSLRELIKHVCWLQGPLGALAFIILWRLLDAPECQEHKHTVESLLLLCSSAALQGHDTASASGGN